MHMRKDDERRPCPIPTELHVLQSGRLKRASRYQQSENTRLAFSGSSQLPCPVDNGERRPGTFTFQK